MFGARPVQPEEGPRSLLVLSKLMLIKKVAVTHFGIFLAAILFLEKLDFPGRESAWVVAVGDGTSTGTHVGMSS